MNNTHKLLLAFIDAMGFEIEEVDLTRTRVPKGADINTREVIYIAGEGLYYTSGVDYKVTKKSFMLGVIDEWKDLTDCEKLMALKKEIKRLQEVPCEKT